jgi:oleate hydratase
VLPPLPENEETLRERAEAELSSLLGKGSQALLAASGWLARWREGLRDKSR